MYLHRRNSKRMPDDVHDAFQQVLVNEGNMDSDQARDYLCKMEKEQRYQTETWS